MQVQAAGLNHTPGTLFALPLLDFPAGFIKAFIDWELPKDRHQDDHYLHPAVPLVSCARDLSLYTDSIFEPQMYCLSCVQSAALMHGTVSA